MHPTLRAVIDASVLFSSVAPSEPEHATSLEMMRKVHAAVARNELELFEPPNFLIEIFAAFGRRKQQRNNRLLSFMDEANGLAINEIVPFTGDEATAFIAHHQKMFGEGVAPFTKGGDLMYLWAAWKKNATLISLDAGLLKYDGHIGEVVTPATYLTRLP